MNIYITIISNSYLELIYLSPISSKNNNKHYIPTMSNLVLLRYCQIKILKRMMSYATINAFHQILGTIHNRDFVILLFFMLHLLYFFFHVTFYASSYNVQLTQFLKNTILLLKRDKKEQHNKMSTSKDNEHENYNSNKSKTTVWNI